MEQPFLSLQGESGPQKVPVAEKPVTIGRHPDNLLVITDTQASRFHAVIGKSRDGYIVKDLDSRNGTRLNGQPVKSSKLNDGDVVSIGTTEIRFSTGNSAGAKRAAPQPAARAAAAKPPQPPQPRKAPQPASMRPPAADEPDLSPADYMQPSSAEDDMVEDIFSAGPAETADLMADLGAVSGQQDDEKFLPVLAESLPDKSFGVDDIALVNARGQIVHPALSTLPEKKRQAQSSEAVMVLRYVFLIAARGRATDVHVEPKNEDYQLRLRIDGTMIDIVRMSKAMGTRLLALVKIMCDIDVQFKNIIQEGHFSAFFPTRRVDYRVSFAPAMFGQKLVIRVLDTANAPLHMNDLHMPAWMLETMQRVSQRDQGMILVTGPTGSGKTTTLYSVLRDVGTERRNVLTIEDPVEIEIQGATQIPVNEEKGNTFPALLRSMLRQDPDVIMVGEIRDAETARIAMQAAMTGHLVLSTLHARDSFGTVFRLLDLGVEPYLVSSSLQIVIAQRLARELCPYCKRGVKPTQDQLEKMGPAAKNVRELFVPKGCPSCLKTGYAGRRGFFEMLTTTEELREVILKNPSPKEIEKSLSGTRFMRLSQTGYQLVAQGVTAFDEIEKAVGRA
ncbi:MAG TPA: ATPase, T2SS/T4P/T4SS family [Tepidisphaeraceae bacterium]|jgi:type II secretory ATPase GspE/PulE/Tfp pilus assembly ATPase PilB-like protein|nr:ATPase, T2SS/T4P/T4SS family [Tepidisphaeraceae bacterium]